MIRNIIFDIGNVLADFCWRDFLRNKGYDAEMTERMGRATTLSPEWNEVDRGVLGWEEIVDSFVKNDPELEKELRSAFSELSGMVRPRAYALAWIRELKKKGYSVYYLSNFSHKVETECPEALAFVPLTDGGILSYRDRLIKPDAAIYELLLSRYGLRGEESVFIDDTAPNIEAAERAGIHGIQFREFSQVLDELEKLSVVIDREALR